MNPVKGKNPVEWTYQVEVGATHPISTSLKNQGCFFTACLTHVKHAEENF